jgi:hypothetical protein
LPLTVSVLFIVIPTRIVADGGRLCEDVCRRVGAILRRAPRARSRRPPTFRSATNPLTRVRWQIAEGNWLVPDHMHPFVLRPSQARSSAYRWCARFVLAIFGWGVGFYGPPISCMRSSERTGWPW